MSLSFYIHTFGCQMNQADSEIVTALLVEGGFAPAVDEAAADVVLLNSCAVRENAEERLGNILTQL
ncbi:MAG: tRNA (N6-isopentenyl adenosine(37)-C2)-methylthiotransferase MiaB, partial [Chlorobaculum sp.]|nr:tRNA (N6-isopentenyl adenosine(37)-C2)-methylthiotransferase MiaB [Chlorobaculum sp.]